MELAERLIELLPPGLTRVFYSDNGSTAVEVALKLAHQYWRNLGEPNRGTFLTLHYAYHGDTVGAMSVSEESVFTDAFRPLLFQVRRADAPYCYRCPLGLERASCRIDCLGSLEAALQEAGRVGRGGARRTDAAGGRRDDRLAERVSRRRPPAVRPVRHADDCRRSAHRIRPHRPHVRVASMRRSRPTSSACRRRSPAGYLPLGATVATDAIFEAFLSEDRAKTFFHGHSFTANPLACAVALASLDLFREQDVLERVGRLESRLRAGLSPLADLPSVGDVRVIGGVGIVELVSDKSTRKSDGYLDGIGPRLSAQFLDRGLLLRPLGNVVYFMPPYCITDDQVDWALEQIAAVLTADR